jgi:S1-C subfamily serine protease
VTTLADLSRDLAALVGRAAPAVLGLVHRRGQGSGVALTSDGYVVTNAHVARAVGPLAARLPDGEEAPAELVGADDQTDLAVVRVGARDLPHLALDEASRPAVGEIVVAIGNPLGFERSVSLGIVSALDRELRGPGALLEGLIQTDAALNPGHSGGPLLDATGAVIGISTAVVPFARGLGFAIPARTAAWVAAVLMRHGVVRRPYLGVVVRAETVGAGAARGIRVLRVEAGTPAADAGLAAEDLLLRANGQGLSGLHELHRALVLGQPGELRLEVLRGGEPREVLVRPRAQAA